MASAVGVACLAGVAFAAEEGTVQSFSADKRLDRGTVVTLDDNQKITPASPEADRQVFGVVVDTNSLSIHVSKRNIKNETFAASSGVYPMLVSNQNGNITSGDYVALSSITGVAMAADTEQPMIIGRAQGNFDGQSNRLSRTDLLDIDGKVVQKVDIGLVPVTIAIEKNPNVKSTKADVPEFLERIGQQIAEKKVSPIRIYLSVAITGISLIIALAILVTGVRQSIVSIGRNPLSKKSIFAALIQVILTSFIILIIGLFAVYLLLRL